MKEYFSKLMRCALALTLVVSLMPSFSWASELAPAETETTSEKVSQAPPEADDESATANEGGESQAQDAAELAVVAEEAADEETDSEAAEVEEADVEIPAFSGGSGKKSDPYLISTAADMWALAKTSKSYNFKGKYFLVTDDIDLGCSEDNQWIPISDGVQNTSDSPLGFKGHFDGGYHVISGLYINEPRNPQALPVE